MDDSIVSILSNLVKLDLGFCHRIRSDGVKEIVRNNPNLKWLSLEGCFINDDGMSSYCIFCLNLFASEIISWILAQPGTRLAQTNSMVRVLCSIYSSERRYSPPMLFQSAFSRSTGPVSHACGLVSQTTLLGWSFEMVSTTSHAASWIFTTPDLVGVFPHVISGMIILSGV